MRPSSLKVITFLARDMPEYAQDVDSPFLKKQLSTTATLLSMLAQDLDRAVPRRIAEAKAIRAIFREAQNVVRDPGLADKIGREAEQETDDLHLSALDAENDRLRELLTQLHAHVETLEDASAELVSEAIWKELALQTERRRTSFLKI